ncbi:hypothetical protein [Streptomyces sp. NPDC050759]|uniref:hypothetical protein n=1 Tax=Streptomyces sp. NPDC050759 TaxID=3365635 RepID=UPI00379316CF
MAAVVLALTGFSSGHKSGRHKSSHRDSDGGGGCSSSSQKHDSYTPRSTSTRSSSTLRDGTALVVSCATKATPYSTAEVTNPNSRKGTFKVSFSFDDKGGHLLSVEYPEVTVPAKGTATVRVNASAALLKHLDHCRVEPEADLVR